MEHSYSESQFDIEQFKDLYKVFNATTLAKLPKLYSADIAFKDPIHTLNGIDALKHYFEGFNSPHLQCRFEFTNEIISTDQAFFQWNMHYSHTSLKKGAPLHLNGSTLIKFKNKIYYHEDYYDMGAMLYQHIPVLGWAIKKLNAHMVKPS